MRKLVVFLLVGFLAGCALFATNDPVRVALYTAKQTWMAGRESAIVACASRTVSVEDCKKFRVADEAYTKRHNELVALYLQAKPISEGLIADLQRLADEVKALAARINGQAEVAL